MGMVGFKFEACSSEGFSYSQSRWTEGSLWLAKAALKGSQNKVASVGANKALIDAIEGEFSKLKDLRFYDAVADTPNFELCVFQDFNFRYKFETNKNSDLKRWELGLKIANCKNDMGDHVALALFECMEAYKVHYISKNLSGKYNYNFLNVWIYL